MTINATVGYARVPAILSFPDTTRFAETYGFGAASGRVWLEGQYLVPSERASKTLYLFMHPSATLHFCRCRRRSSVRPVRGEPLSKK